MKLEDVTEVSVDGDVEAKVNVFVPAVVCVKFVNVATPLTAVTVVVPPKVPPDTVTVTDAFECVTVFKAASITRTDGCCDNNDPDAAPMGRFTTCRVFGALKARIGRT